MPRLKLFEREDGISLGVFRAFFGVIMTLQFITFREQVPMFVDSAMFLFTYDFFHWIKPFPEPYLTGVLTLLVLNSAVFATGRFYRITAIIQFVGMFYVFHLGKALYNNHYYLFILISLLMVFVRGNAEFVLLGKKTHGIPRWQRILIQTQIVIVFFYGGIAKMNSEWLFHFQPIKAWLPDMLGSEIMQLITENQMVMLAAFLSYFGLLFDLVIGFLILSKRTRSIGVPLYLAFHLMNAVFFNIGLFPWFCMGALCLFVEQQTLVDFLAGARKWLLNGKTRQARSEQTEQHSPVKHHLAKAFFFGWIFFQLVIPFRHWFIDGWVLWDERGYNFSWFMKLRTKEPRIAIKAKIGNDPADYYIELEKFLTKNQGRSIGYKPVNLVQFAHFLEAFYREKGELEDIRIYADVTTQLHDHKPQRLVDPNVDLTSLDINNDLGLSRYDWVVPFQDR